ncbi:MAG TPA: lamin tail domain-containing protein [Cyclobacteriaceae bacterium]|nr:lamin tail domain-containing protein [Cyclobacteriaceae bacterium]
MAKVLRLVIAMKKYSIIFFFVTNVCSAQTEINYDFINNDLSLWTGNISHFIINTSHQLQLNNNVAGTSYIATTFAPVQTNLEWNVYVRQAFAGSANNYGRVYLLSSNPDLTQPTEGYFLQLGEAGSNDAVELFRQSGTVLTSICRAANAAIAGSFAIRIKVTRDETGTWKVFIDYAAGTDFVEAATGNDLTHVSGQWMGMVCVYTAGNAARFYYDDVYAGAPKLPPPPADVADRFDVVINEFFPDPVPSVGLPEEEFVELFNRSSKTFRLHGWRLGDATSLQSLPDVEMKPGDYVVVKNTVSLNNSNDVIKIIDDRGVLIDSLSYDLSWYQEVTKSGGGYTIERLDPEVGSTEPANWYASQSDVGGTPGVINSVFGRNPDSKAPVIEGISLQGDSIIVKVSEVVVAERANYEPLDKIASVVFITADTTIVIVLENLTNGADYTLKITSLSDLAGNYAPGKEFGFTYFIPHRVNPGDLVINEFMADPTPVVQLPEVEYIELFNRSVHPVSLAGWHIEDLTTSAALPSLIVMPNSFVLVTSTTNASKFPNAVGITSFPSLGNAGDNIVLRSSDGLAIDSLNYDLSWYQEEAKANGGYSIERINPDVTATDPTNWYASQDERGGTPGLKNSVLGRNPDTKAPIIKRVFLRDDLVIVKASEPVIADKSNYHPSDNITSVVFNPPDTSVIIHLENLTNGSKYLLKITHLSDLAGNIAKDEEFAFTYFIPHKINPKDIVITEIMADPTPVVQLPEAEYIELLNRSPHPVSLSGWHIEDLTTSAALPPLIVLPNSFVLLTSTTNAPRLPGAIGVTSFPSLGNLSERIVLRNAEDVAIDSLVYNTSWYHNSEKSDGGWSLELIDINNPCGEGDNWVASEDIDGGTPGEANSVFANKPDLSPPEVVGLFPISPDTLVISFNEKLGSFDGDFSLPGKARIGYKDIVYSLDEPLLPRTEYPMTISSVSDCSGNVIQPLTLNFSLPEPAAPNDIVINEVLFNPRPTGVDFIEIYNRSPKFLNLKNWTVSGETITTPNAIIKPSSYLALTASIVSVESNYLNSIGKPMLEMHLPSMPDDEGTIILSDPAGVVIDRFSYSAGMHSSIISDPEGVSLERISFEDSTQWHSASESSGFATPGYLNSSSRPGSLFDERSVNVIPEVIDRASSPFSQIFYRFDNPGLVANVSVVDLEGRIIKTIATNETISAEGTYQWDGDRDAGGRARAGYYMLWFQTFDLEGRVSTYRRRVVVGF